MAEYKVQHFVPASYLRAFAVDDRRRSIRLYSFSSGRYVLQASIKSQCASDYFYGRDGRLEKALSGLEGFAASIFERARTAKCFQPTASELFAVAAYLSLQDCRTEYAVRHSEIRNSVILDIIREEASKTLLDGFENFDHLKASMSIGTTMFPMILDLKVALLDNVTPVEFITSDHPVVKRNNTALPPEYLPSRGTSKSGLIMLLPIGPRRAVIAYDGGVYRLSNKIDGIVRIKKAATVDSINMAIAADAHKTVYFSTGHDERSIAHFAKALEEARKVPSATAVELFPGPEPNTYYRPQPGEVRPPGARTIIQSVEGVQRTTLALPELKLRPDPQYFNDGTAACPLRDPAWYDIVGEAAKVLETSPSPMQDFRAFVVAHPRYSEVRGWKERFFG